MNKMLIVGIPLLIIGASYFLLSAKKEETKAISPDTLVSSYGFSLQAPKGWRFWEGVSAAEDASFNDAFGDFGNMSFDPGSQNFVNLQNYLNSWTPSKSKILVFSSADVDFKSKDLIYIGQMALQMDKEPLVFDIVRVVISDRPIKYAAAGSYPSKDISHIEVKGISGKIQESISTSETGNEYNVVITQVPLGDRHILIESYKKRGEVSISGNFIAGLVINSTK